MRLIEIMQSLGDRLGIVEKVTAATVKSPLKVVTRRVTLVELMAEIPAEQVRALAEEPAELTVSFAQVYEAAGIGPSPQGWTVEKLRDLLKTGRFQGLDRPSVQKGILEALAKDGVEVQDLVRDAVARDKALDAFENFARRKVGDRAAARARKISEIEGKIRELQKEQAGLREMAAADEKAWAEWRRMKRLAEKDMASTVGYLIDEQVISTDDGEGP